MAIKPNATYDLEFVLAWDMPTVEFPMRMKKYSRYYTKYFGADGAAGPKICDHALKSYFNWEKLIDAWQKPVLEDRYPFLMFGIAVGVVYAFIDLQCTS